MNQKKIVNVASYQRIESLIQSLKSIYNQCDVINVCLNNHTGDIPKYLLSPKINLTLTDNSKGDAFKFLYLEESDGYFLTIDDDLIYPPNYVDYMISKSKEYTDKKIITLHGRSFSKFPIQSYYRSATERYQCLGEVKNDVKVQFGGTGVMCFHTSLLKKSIENFYFPNMADVWIGKFAKEKGIEIICVSHKQGYVKEISQKTTIYNTESKNDSKQTNIVNQIFGYGKTLKNISIIIPTYKNVEFLPECFDSILKSVKDLDCEILVGIDSCQETLNYVKNNRFDSRFKFYLFEKNVGPYVIKNSLTNMSSSDKILFFDSDDIMTEDLIPNVIDGLNSQKVYRPMYVDFIDGIKIRPFNNLKTNHFGYGVIGIDKETFLSLNGFEGWRCEADNDFLNRLNSRNIPILHGISITILRRIHKNGLTSHPNTNYKSQLREQYRKLSSKHRPNGKCEKFETSNFIEVKVNGFENDKKDIFELKREEKRKLLNSVIPTVKKETKVDYNSINSVLNRDNEPTTKSKGREPVQNLPKDRKEIFEKKRESNYDIINKLLSENPNKKHKYPDIEPFRKKN